MIGSREKTRAVVTFAVDSGREKQQAKSSIRQLRNCCLRLVRGLGHSLMSGTAAIFHRIVTTQYEGSSTQRQVKALVY